jgi:hypothetical protein
MNTTIETGKLNSSVRPNCGCRSVSFLSSGRARPRRRTIPGMKRLLRCCRLHDEQYILHVLGLFFAYRGRKYKQCPQTAASPFPRVIVDDRPTGVRLWIAQATQYLCADAKKRIRKEITGHCQDAQAAFMESGLSREEAGARVLEDLGDPLQANAAFQKTYMTSAQERYMARVSQLGKTQYQVLYLSIFISCFVMLLESALLISKLFGWFEATPYMLYELPGFSLCFLVYARLGIFNEKNEQRYRDSIRAPIERKITWILFGLAACLYCLLTTWIAPERSVLPCLAVVVPFLYGIVHRAVIRDIVAFLSNSPRARKYVMLGYSAVLFSLAPATALFFYWIVGLELLDRNYRATYAFSVLFGMAIPTVLGLLWFGGHALTGAFFVSKCSGRRTVPANEDPEEERPA